MGVSLPECGKCGAIGTIVDLGCCCRIRAKIAAAGGTGGALPEDIATAAKFRLGLLLPEAYPFSNTKG